jgi:hypothetical protein
VAHFLDHSRASLLEVKNELGVGLDRGYFGPEDVESATRLVKRALKALSGPQQYLRSPQAKLNAQRPRTGRTHEPTPPERVTRYGSANTKIEFVACGMRASGIVSVTMLLAHEPPPVPTGTATYCLPFTAYVIGNP